MHKKFEINQTKIKGGCQSRRKVVPYNSKSDLPLVLRLCETDEVVNSGSFFSNGAQATTTNL